MGKRKKNEDFQKKKLKVGKGSKPTNVTDVSLKVQAIQVPLQKIQKSRDTVQEKLEHLYLQLAHLKHHNQTIRSDAIKALLGILEQEPRLFILSLGKVINSIGISLMDEQDSIRKQILGFSETLFDTIADTELVPFFSTLLVYTSSSMTHINERIRLSGLRFSKILCTKYPLLITKFGKILLPQYMEIMNANKKSMNRGFSIVNAVRANSQMGKSRDEVLDSFYGYLGLITKMERKTKESVVTKWDDASPLLGVPKWLQVDTLGESKVVAIGMQDIKALMNTLVDFWIESSENVFSKSDIVYSSHLTICEMIVSILRMLCIQFADEPDWNFDLVIQHIHPHFPFAKKLSCDNQKSLEIISKMNCEYSTVSLFLASKKEGPVFVQPVYDFVLEYFDTTIPKDHSILLPVIIDLFRSLDASKRKKLLKTIIRFDEKKNSLVPFEMVRNIVFGAGISDAEMIKSWILNLPKRLYQLRNKDLVYSEQILLFISQFLSKLNIENAKEFLESLDKNITPLFYAFLERGPIAGPVVHFRVELQEKVLNILYYLDTWSLQLTKAICYACQHPQFPASSVGYVMDLATARQLGAQKLNLDLFYSFKLSCMLGISRFELDELKSSQTGPAGLIIDPKEDKKHDKRFAKYLKMRITPNADESDFFKPALIQLLSSPVPLSTFLTVLSISKDVESKELNKLLVNGIIDVISISPTQHSIAQVDDFFNLRNLEQFMEYSLEWSRISDKSTDF